MGLTTPPICANIARGGHNCVQVGFSDGQKPVVSSYVAGSWDL